MQQVSQRSDLLDIDIIFVQVEYKSDMVHFLSLILESMLNTGLPDDPFIASVHALISQRLQSQIELLYFVVQHLCQEEIGI